MTLSESWAVLRRWANDHYGLIALICGLTSLALAFIQTSRLQSQAVILDYKMTVVERQLTETQQSERDRLAHSQAIAQQLREVKGYVQGMQEGTMRNLIERLPNEEK